MQKPQFPLNKILNAFLWPKVFTIEKTNGWEENKENVYSSFFIADIKFAKSQILFVSNFLQIAKSNLYDGYV